MTGPDGLLGAWLADPAELDALAAGDPAFRPGPGGAAGAGDAAGPW